MNSSVSHYESKLKKKMEMKDNKIKLLTEKLENSQKFEESLKQELTNY